MDKYCFSDRQPSLSRTDDQEGNFFPTLFLLLHSLGYCYHIGHSLNTLESRPSSTTSIDSLTSVENAYGKETLTNSMTVRSLPSNHQVPQIVQYANADVAEVSRNWRKNFGSLQSMCLVYKDADRMRNALDHANPHSTDAYNIKLWFEKVQREAKHLSHQKLMELKQYADKKWLHFDFDGIDVSSLPVKPAPSKQLINPEWKGGRVGLSIHPTDTLENGDIQKIIEPCYNANGISPLGRVKQDDCRNVVQTALSNRREECRQVSTSRSSSTPVKQINSSIMDATKTMISTPAVPSILRAPNVPTSAVDRNPSYAVQPLKHPSATKSSAATTVKPNIGQKAWGRKPNKNTLRKQVKESNDQIWFEHFDLLIQYSIENENCNIPKDYVVNMDGITYRLGEWLEIQRAVFYEVGECDLEKFQLLEELVLNKGLWCTDIPAVDLQVNDGLDGCPGKSSSFPITYATPIPAVNSENASVTIDDNDSTYLNSFEDAIVSLAPMKRKDLASSQINSMQTTKSVRGKSAKSKGSALIAEQKSRKIRRTRSKKCTNDDSNDDSSCSNDGNGFDSDPEFQFDDKDDSDNGDQEVHITSCGSSSFKRISHIRDAKTLEISETVNSLIKADPSAETKTPLQSALRALDSIPVSESDEKSSSGSTPAQEQSGNPALDPQANGGLLTRRVKLGRSKGNNPSHNMDEPNYLGFIYGKDGSTEVFFGIGMVTKQTVVQACLIYSIELMKPKDPVNFLDSEFFLEPDEKSQIRHHHIVLQNLRFEKGNLEQTAIRLVKLTVLFINRFVVP